MKLNGSSRLCSNRAAVAIALIFAYGLFKTFQDNVLRTLKALWLFCVLSFVVEHTNRNPEYRRSLSQLEIDSFICELRSKPDIEVQSWLLQQLLIDCFSQCEFSFDILTPLSFTLFSRCLSGCNTNSSTHTHALGNFSICQLCLLYLWVN